MNKKIKATMIVAALALAGGGTWKAYDYSESHKQSLMASNIDALSYSAFETEIMATWGPAALELIKIYGPKVLELLGIGWTLIEIEEYFNPPKHLDWVSTGETRPYTYRDKDGNEIQTTQLLQQCRNVDGKDDDICKAGKTRWV